MRIGVVQRASFGGVPESKALSRLAIRKICARLKLTTADVVQSAPWYTSEPTFSPITTR